MKWLKKVIRMHLLLLITKANELLWRKPREFIITDKEHLKFISIHTKKYLIIKATLFIVTLFCSIILCAALFSQSVSVEPTRLYFKAGKGNSETQVVKVTNNSKIKQAFEVTFADFEPDGIRGKVKIMKADSSIHSCAKWLSADPSLFEIDAGASNDVQVILQPPDDSVADNVKWALMSIKLNEEKTLNDCSSSKEQGLNIHKTFQFAIYIFQTPPNLTNSKAEIVSFKEITKLGDTLRTFTIEAKNTGETILDCSSYMRITNILSNKVQLLKMIPFTLLPGLSRQIIFVLPKGIEKGKYKLIGIVVSDDKMEFKSEEKELEIN
jgi:P pilus assembly chaperone PapD